MAEALQYQTGAIIHVEPEKGGYTVTQVKLLSPPQFTKPSDDDNRVDFDIDLGPLHIKGYVDITKGEIYVEIVVIGITIGTFSFSLKDGLTININLLAVSGWIKFYVKNGNELWVKYHLEIIFDGTFDGDEKIISW